MKMLLQFTYFFKKMGFIRFLVDYVNVCVMFQCLKTLFNYRGKNAGIFSIEIFIFLSSFLFFSNLKNLSQKTS